MLLATPTFLLLLFYEFGMSDGQRSPCPTRPSNATLSSEKLRRLRAEMQKVTPSRPALEAFIITTDDEHQGEWSADRDKRLAYLTEYTGRVAQAAVTRTKSAMWVEEEDYWLADSQLECDWAIFRLETDKNPQITEWLRKEIRTGVRVGADPRLIPESLWDEWKRDLEVNHVALTEVGSLVDDIWYDRPVYSSQQAYFIDGGESRDSKLEKLRANLTRMECGAMVVTALDEIAWLLNVRGNEGFYIPFVRSYLIVTARSDVYWYLPREQKTEIINKELERGNISRIRTHTYEAIWKDLRISGPNWGNILVPSRCEFSAGASHAVAAAIAPSRRVMRQSPVVFLKAQKNDAEVEGMRQASLRDSAAFIDFMANLEEEMKNTSVLLTEQTIAEKLEDYQRGESMYVFPAAPAKVAFGYNGPLRNYQPEGNSSAAVDDSSTLVVRTAHHYLDGTTSVARTFHFGQPSLTQIQTYTRTVASLIEFSRQVFPKNMRTTELDIVGRMPLWKSGNDYTHRTGHGIGSFSSYRESPVNINRKPLSQMNFLQKGSFVSAGPSQSKPGVFGVELRSVFELVSNDSSYLRFHEVTLVPFETRLIEPRDLTVEQVNYINNYHHRVMQTVGAELKRRTKMKGFYWLMKKTQAIQAYCNSVGNVPANALAILALFLARYVL